MGSIADVFFTATLDDKRLGIDAKRAGDKAGQTLGQSLSASIKKSFSGGELGKGIVQGLGLAGALGAANLASNAIGGLTNFIGEATEAASDLNEETSKSGIIFGKNAGEVQAWASTMADAAGQSERAALQAASGFAGLFATVGTGLDESTKRAKELTQLGSDLASFFNTDVQTALDALKSGLSGESEPLRQFNVFLSETAVSAKLAQMGIKKVGGQFTESQKATARYKLILEQTSDAQGDFARTADGLANSQRTADATLENYQATLGQKFLPIALQVTKWQIDFIEGLEAIDQAMTSTAEETRAYNQALEELIRQYGVGGFSAEQLVQRMKDLITTNREGARTFGKGWEAGIAVLRGIQGVVGPAIAGMGDLGDASEDAAIAVRKSAREILASIQAIRDGAVGDAEAAAAALYDPLILEAEAAATQIERLEQKRIIANKESTAEEIRIAKSKLLELNKVQIEQIGQLLTYGTRAEQISKTSAFLASDFWVQAYEGATPEQAAALDAWRLTLETKLDGMTEDARTGGEETVDSYSGEIKDGRGEVDTSTAWMLGPVAMNMKDAAKDAYTYGQNAATNYANGLKSKIVYVNKAGQAIANEVARYLRVSSPAEAGPLSLGGGPEGWGERIPETLADGMRRQISEVLNAARDVAGGVASGLAMTPAYSLGSAVHVPTAGGLALPSGSTAAAVAPGGRVVNINVEVEGLMKARNPFELNDRLQRLARDGTFDDGEEYQ